MKLSEKIDMFSRVAMQEAMDKHAGIMRDIDDEYEKAVLAAEERARVNAGITLRSEIYKAEQKMHMQRLVAAAEQKKVLAEHCNRLIDGLFAEVKDKLAAFAKSREYKDYLLEQIKAKTSGELKDSKYEIMLRPDDMAYADEIRRLTGADIVKSPVDFIGGFKIILTEKRAVIDATFSYRLKDEQRSFAIHV